MEALGVVRRAPGEHELADELRMPPGDQEGNAAAHAVAEESAFSTLSWRSSSVVSSAICS